MTYPDHPQDCLRRISAMQARLNASLESTAITPSHPSIEVRRQQQPTSRAWFFITAAMTAFIFALLISAPHHERIVPVSVCVAPC